MMKTSVLAATAVKNNSNWLRTCAWPGLKAKFVRGRFARPVSGLVFDITAAGAALWLRQ